MPLVKLKINGKDVTAEAGTMILKAALDNGVYIPHFCWHPALSVSGNCRMCMVKVKDGPKPIPSCAVPVQEGMVVETESDEIAAIRRSNLEFLLLNHPLDCPVCDQAGECVLQDYTFMYGSCCSRFTEKKNNYHTKDLGPSVKLWGERCIVCSRCVRFLREVSGTSEIDIVNRGDRSVVDVFPGVELDNPIAGNVVDICPVGALISKDFLYQARVWYMQNTDTVCAMCSTGCSITAGTYQGKIKRLKPRLDPAVNGHWMCDEGRMSYKIVHSENRFDSFLARKDTPEHAKVTPAEAAKIVRSRLGPRAVIVVSAFVDNEGYAELKALADQFQVGAVGLVAKADGFEKEYPGGFAINRDKNPNRAGFEKVFGKGPAELGAAKAYELINSGKADTLYYIGGMLDGQPPNALVIAAAKAGFLVVQDTHRTLLADGAHVILPALTWAEKKGTFVNSKVMERVFVPVVEPHGDAASDADIFRMVRG